MHLSPPGGGISTVDGLAEVLSVVNGSHGVMEACAVAMITLAIQGHLVCSQQLQNNTPVGVYLPLDQMRTR